MLEIYSETYLSQLIRDQVQESLHLDYKKTDALDNTEKNKQEISKDVSAFANSDGGIIIYGIVEKKHLPEKIEGRKPEEGKREWLEQVINSRIEPRIWGVKIVQIDLQGEDEHAVYVVEIPQSHTAHQAFDRKYYRRFNFQSVAMHDYEVKQTMNRAREPILHLTLEELQRVFLPIPNARARDQEHAIALEPNEFPSHGGNLIGKYEIFAENMTPKYGKILINLVRGILSIQFEMER